MVTALIMGVFIIPAQASITEISILPENPTTTDNISFDISGVEAEDVSITGSIFIIDGLNLELNIDFHNGFLMWVDHWSHTEDIGTLPVGTYNLTVNTFFDTHFDYNDSFNTSFEVVPEPATILLVGAGFLGIRKYNS